MLFPWLQVAGLGNNLIFIALLYLCIVCGTHFYHGEVIQRWSCPAAGGEEACLVIDYDTFPSFFGTAVFACFSCMSSNSERWSSDSAPNE